MKGHETPKQSKICKKNKMKSFDEDTHSFLVRIRPEKNEKGKSAELRGKIEHLPSKNFRYLKDLEGITSFISRYLRKIGVKEIVHHKWSKWRTL